MTTTTIETMTDAQIKSLRDDPRSSEWLQTMCDVALDVRVVCEVSRDDARAACVRAIRAAETVYP